MNIHKATYRSWQDMKQRCYNPRNHNYPNYGGRGIKVCERWMVFESFIADMGKRPSGLTLDRINNDGDYEPGNCRWATWQQQHANQRLSNQNKVKTHCLRGHPLEGDNVVIRRRDGRLHRSCRACQVFRDARYWREVDSLKQRAAAKER